MAYYERNKQMSNPPRNRSRDKSECRIDHINANGILLRMFSRGIDKMCKHNARCDLGDSIDVHVAKERDGLWVYCSQDLAELLDISISSIRAWGRTGRVAAKKNEKGKWVFLYSDLKKAARKAKEHRKRYKRWRDEK